jgi:hypothetical protein
LPRISCVIPKEDLLKCGEQASHVFDLQVSSHASRGWRVNGFYIAQLPIAKLFHCRFSIANCRFFDVNTRAKPLLQFAIGNWKSAI